MRKKSFLQRIDFGTYSNIYFLINSVSYARLETFGDANLDGKINISDSLKVLRHIASQKLTNKEGWTLKEEEFYQADIDGNAKVDITDYLHLQRYIAANKAESIKEKHPEWITALQRDVPVSPEKIVLNKSHIVLDTRDVKEQKLEVNIYPEDSTTTLTWNSSAPNVAKVDAEGVVKAVANGKANITVTTENGITATCEVIVQTSPEQIVLNQDNITLQLGGTESATLQATILPSNVNVNNQLTWTSSNSNVVSVNQQGEIKAISAGNAIITVKSENGIQKICRVIVVEIPTSLNFDKKQVLLSKEHTGELILTFDTALDEMDLSQLKIESENEQVAIYDHYEKYGDKQIKIFFNTLNEGATNINASMGEFLANCEIVVYSQGATLEIFENQNKINNELIRDISCQPNIFDVEARLNENKNIMENVRWSSSNEDVATIDNNGTVQIKSIGTTSILAQVNEELYKEITLKIEASPKSITVQKNEFQLYINGEEEAQIQANIIPSNASIYNKITYSSSDESVVTVDANGKIKAKSSGIANIIAKTQNNKTVSVLVKVNTLPSSITLSTPKRYLKIGESQIINPTISPKNADAQNKITWSSSNSNILSVDNAGKIKALNYGKATITAKTQNGKSATIDVIVPKLVTNVQNLVLDLSVRTTATINTSGSSYIGNVTYSSTNTNCVVVSSNGIITAKANGSANIIVKESNSNAQITIPVKVITTTTGLTLNKTKVDLDIVEATYQLTATHAPATVTNKSIIWTSSNPNVATVSGGKITRVSSGTTTITATANDGSKKTATCVVNVKKEKMIIVGASTIRQLAAQKRCSSIEKDIWQVNYYTDYGYKVRAEENYYDYLSDTQKGATDKAADLFFVCASGTGYYWLAGERPYDYLDKSGTAGAGEARIKEIISNNSNQNSHFTIAFLTGGNDLMKPTTKAQVNNVADLYGAYYKKIAKQYPKHDFYVFPVTPVDESNASAVLKETGYDVPNSNNTKRYRFASRLNDQIDNTGNLNYADGNYNYFKSLEENGTYSCYDGKHFTKPTAKIVLEKIFDVCKVLSSGKKK